MEPAAPVAPAPAAPAAAPVNVAPEVTGDTATPGAPDVQQPERTFTQKELDEAVEKRLRREARKREEIQRERDYWKGAHLEKSGAQPQPQQQPRPDAQGEQAPKRDSFDTYEDYIRADAKWHAEQAAERRLNEREQKAREEADRKKADETAAEFRKRMKESAKGLEDFEDVMAEATRDANQPVARLFGDAVDALENPGRVLYELAKNQDEAERIAALPLARQARELVLLEGKLAQQPQQRRSSAPAPIEPVGGKGHASTDEITGNESPEEFRRKREAQIRKQRTGA